MRFLKVLEDMLQSILLLWHGIDKDPNLHEQPLLNTTRLERLEHFIVFLGNLVGLAVYWTECDVWM